MDAKALQEDLQSLGFTSSLAKPEIGKGVEKRRVRSSDESNQQPPQRGGVVPDLVWIELKWLLVFSKVPVTPHIPLRLIGAYLFAYCLIGF